MDYLWKILVLETHSRVIRTLCTLTMVLLVHFSTGQNISVSVDLPPQINVESKVKVTLLINKGSVSGFAKVQVGLPLGFEATEGDKANSTFTFKDTTVKFLWMALPPESSFTVSFYIKAAPWVSGKQFLTGYFAYILNNETQRFTFQNKEFDVVTGAVTSNTVVQKIDATNNASANDKTPPKIAILYPSNILAGSRVSTELSDFLFVGSVSDAGGVFSVKINNKDVLLDSKGNFQCTIKLPYGDTQVGVMAEDMNSNKGSFRFTLSRIGASVMIPPIETKGAIVTNLAASEPTHMMGKYYALIIAEQDYTDKNINDLTYPLSDAKIFSSTLKANYIFDSIKQLSNASRSKIIETIYSYRKTLTERDNFLLFYSGHGFWDEESGQGYWLPADANMSDPSTWISNNDIKDQFKPMKCGHALLISDACFSGGIFKTRDASIANASKSIQELYQAKSRKAMTSGALTTVPDKSVFLKYMVEGLKNNTSPYMSSEKLFASFKENAINNTTIKNLIPQYGVISETDDRGGDFIFVKK